MSTTVWKDVAGYEGLYEVSSEGYIRNCATGKIQAKNLMGCGYHKADLWKQGKRKQTSVHRVVCETFYGLCEGKEVNHINGIKTDNRVENLEWSTKSENNLHRMYSLGQTIKAITATNIATGQQSFFKSYAEATTIGGFHRKEVSLVLKGARKSHKGFMFSYTENQ